MKDLATLLDSYTESHQLRLNKIMHWIGIPCVLLAILLLFSWLHLSMPGLFDIHTSWLFYIGLISYYTRFDMHYALVLGAIMLPLVFAANVISAFWFSMPLFCILFAAGSILQLVGHFLEDEQPTFLSRPSTLLVLPLIMLAEIIDLIGFETTPKIS